VLRNDSLKTVSFYAFKIRVKIIPTSRAEQIPTKAQGRDE